jgi:hypothetical protein
MSESNGKIVPVDMALFQRNRLKVDPAMLQPYINKRVAWNGDGTCILASGSDYPEVFAELDRLGVRTNQVVFDFIDDPATIYI